MEMGNLKPCPNCGKMTPGDGAPWRPFCSERCRLIDLGKWAAGEYRIPGEKITRGPFDFAPRQSSGLAQGRRGDDERWDEEKEGP